LICRRRRLCLGDRFIGGFDVDRFAGRGLLLARGRHDVFLVFLLIRLFRRAALRSERVGRTLDRLPRSLQRVVERLAIRRTIAAGDAEVRRLGGRQAGDQAIEVQVSHNCCYPP
jgi:hypothetical protein